jgi:hypothetical protein
MPAQDRQDPPRVVKINDSVSMAPSGANVDLVTTPAVETLHLTDVVLASDQNNRDALGARLKALEYLREHT